MYSTQRWFPFPLQTTCKISSSFPSCSLLSYLVSSVTVYLFRETCGIGVTWKVRSWACKNALSGPKVGSNSSGQLRIQTFPEPPRLRRLSATSRSARCTKAFVSTGKGASS